MNQCEWDDCERRGVAIFNGHLLCIDHIVQALEENNTNRLQKLLKNMDIPEQRKNDLPWLKRNIHIRNATHPDLHEACQIIQILLK